MSQLLKTLANIIFDLLASLLGLAAAAMALHWLGDFLPTASPLETVAVLALPALATALLMTKIFDAAA